MAVTSMANSSIRDFQKFNSMRAFGSFVKTQYVIIAGGGGGASAANTNERSGGAGAGGYRCSVPGENSGGGKSAEMS